MLQVLVNGTELNVYRAPVPIARADIVNLVTDKGTTTAHFVDTWSGC